MQELVEGEAADLWRLMLQHSPIGMAVVSPDGRLLTVNRSLCEMLGYSEEALLRLGFQDLTHADDLDADLALFGQTLAGEIDSYRLAKRYLHADGRVVWGDLSAPRAGGRAGARGFFNPLGLEVTLLGYKELGLLAATAEVERERQTLEAIFETVSVGLLLIGPDGSYQRMNRRHAETMSIPFPQGHEGTAGQPGEVYLIDGKTPMPREAMPSYRATRGEEFDDYTYWVGGDPATRAAYSTSARQVRGPSGEPLGAALAYQEITDLVRAIRVKDEFVASVSHELRTPLTSVLGHLELLGERDDLSEEVAAHLRVVQRNTQRLQALLADLLLIGELADGTLRLQAAPVDLAALVVEAVEASEVSAERRGVDVRVESPDRLLVTADWLRVRQVLDNLITNAIKYSHSGGSVVVTLRRDGEDVTIEVADTGMGIAADELDHVFGRFFRGDRAVAEHVPGTGLGLSIVSSIVSAHGGTVDVESEPGRGTTFRVVLPGLAGTA